ncbi:MAG: response regulator [Clostridia bacterium]|nr:response regulator [Clostridia bacterium]
MKRILIAEQNRNYASALQAMLSGAGYEADVVYDGWLAYNRLTEKEYDLLLMEMDCPRLSAADLLTKIHAQAKVVPTVGLTDKHPFFRTDEESFTAVLGKPVRAEQLLSTIESILNKGEKND